MAVIEVRNPDNEKYGSFLIPLHHYGYMEKRVLSNEEYTEKILNSMQKAYGFIPPVMQIMSRRPDVFVPAAKFGKAVLESNTQELDRKVAYLCAVSAASALGAEHCLNVQMRHAKDSGATADEAFEALMIGSYIAMTRAQSYALRKFNEIYPPEEGSEGKIQQQ